jgi:hypothetical protein
MIKLLTALLIALSWQSASAIGAVTAKVTQVRVDGNGAGMIYFDQPLSGSPGCVTSAFTTALAFSATTGKQILALALWAKSMNISLTVYGNGACGTYGVVEDFGYAQSN